jgi:hypothetical protein
VSFITVSAGRTEIEGVGKQGAGWSVGGDGGGHKISDNDFKNFVLSPSRVKCRQIKDGWVCRKCGRNK